MNHPIATRLVSLTMALLMVLAVPASALEGIVPQEEGTVTYDAYGNEISNSDEVQEDPFVIDGTDNGGEERTEVLSDATEEEPQDETAQPTQEETLPAQEETLPAQEEPVYVQDGAYLAPEKLILHISQWLDEEQEVKAEEAVTEYTGIVAFYDYNVEDQEKMLETPYYFYYEKGQLQEEKPVYLLTDRVMSAVAAPAQETVEEELLPAYTVEESYVDPEAETHPELLFAFNEESEGFVNGLYTGVYEDTAYQEGQTAAAEEEETLPPAEELEDADSQVHAQLAVKAQLTMDGVKMTWQTDSQAKGYRVLVDGSVAADLDAGAAQWLHEDAVSGQSHTYGVQAYYGEKGTDDRESESENAALWGPVSAVSDVLYLAAPELTSGTGSSNSITIRWKAVAGAKQYRVYRKSASGGGWSQLSEVTSTSFTDKSSAMKPGGRFYYTVRAVSGSFISAYEDTSKDKSNSIAIVTTPAVTVTSGTGITVTWKKDNAANGYRVYRKKSGQSGWTVIAEIGKNSTVRYQDKTITAAGKYCYTVRANYGNGVWSGYRASSWVNYKADIPVIGDIYSDTDGMRVKWTPVSGAVGYVVYRKGTSGKFAKLARVNGQKTSSYLDKKASANGVYTYTVRAVLKDSSGKEYLGGYYSSNGYFTYHAAPKVNGYVSNVGAILNWTVDSKATGYRVYRKGSNGKLTAIKNYNKASLANKSSIRFVDEDVTGSKLEYCVRAYYGSGNISKTRVDTENNWSAVGWRKLNNLGTPKMNATAENQKDAVKVTWKKVSGAAGYAVYRRTGNGAWSKLATIKNGSTQTYLDQKNLKAGTTYYYTVRAMDAEGIMNDYDRTGSVVVYMPAPTLEKVTEGSKGLTVRWGKVANVDSYLVYRKTRGGSWKRIATVAANSTSYLDTTATGAATNYIYTVRGYKRLNVNGKAVSFSGSYNVTGTSVGIRMSGNGWVVKNKQTYYVQNGFCLTGWQYLKRNGATYKYYFDEETGALVTNLYSYFGKSYRNLKCQVEVVINTNNSNPSRFTIYLYDSSTKSFCIPAVSVRCIGNPNLTFYRTSTNFTQGFMRKGNGTRYLDTGSATIYEVYATYISGTPAWTHSTQYSGTRNHRNFRYTTYNSLSDNKNNSGGCIRLQCVYAFLVQDIVKNGYGKTNNIKCLLYKNKSEKGPFGVPVIDKISKTNTEPTDPYITGKFFYDTSIWGINVKAGAKAWTYYKA